MNYRILKKPIGITLIDFCLKGIAMVLLFLPTLIISSVVNRIANVSEDYVEDFLIYCGMLSASALSCYIAIKKMKMATRNDILGKSVISSSKSFALYVFSIIANFGVQSFFLFIKKIVSASSETSVEDGNKSIFFILGSCCIAPILEEILFRGCIQGWMRRNGLSPIASILIASLLFGLVHIHLAQIVTTFLAGVILGIAYWRTQSIYIPCLIHITNNTIITTSGILMSDTNSEVFLIAPVIYLVITIVCISVYFLFLKICKWNSLPAKSLPPTPRRE